VEIDMLFRPFGSGADMLERPIYPGDLLAGGESLTAGAITVAGSSTWTAAAIATGIILRTGPAAGYTDTTDTAVNILNALAANTPQASVVPGTSFRMLLINTVAQALTFAAGVGVVVGLGTVNVAASLVREYLWTVLNTTPVQVVNSNTTNASPTVTFVLPNGAVSYPLLASNGPAAGALNITPGATVTGTGIAAGTTVVGLTLGQGGIIGVTLSQNATATGQAALTFGPTMRIDGIRSSTL
jgi:hypothetical protein